MNTPWKACLRVSECVHWITNKDSNPLATHCLLLSTNSRNLCPLSVTMGQYVVWWTRLIQAAQHNKHKQSHFSTFFKRIAWYVLRAAYGGSVLIRPEINHYIVLFKTECIFGHRDFSIHRIESDYTHSNYIGSYQGCTCEWPSYSHLIQPACYELSLTHTFLRSSSLSSLLVLPTQHNALAHSLTCRCWLLSSRRRKGPVMDR